MNSFASPVFRAPGFEKFVAFRMYTALQARHKDSNTYEFETMRQIEMLEKSLGGLAACKRLGFIFEDEKGIMSLSKVGLGYLLYVKARDITSVAEAFAAGYECAHEEKS